MVSRKFQMTRLLLLLLMLTSLSFSYAPPGNYVTVKFANLDLLNKGWSGRKLYFKINGTTLSPDGISHQIKINSKSLDNFFFSFDSTFKNAHPCLTKFIAGQSYKIRLNPCSDYELLADSSPKNGQIRFRTINSNDTLLGIVSPIFKTDTLVKNTLTEYFQNYASAMCPFAPTELYFAHKDKSGEVPTDEGQIIAETYFHFLQGEMVTVTFNGKTKKISLTVDGYIK